MRELERTFLAKCLPKDLKKYPKVEVFDYYIPKSSPHPYIRIRKIGQRYEITKKKPLDRRDASLQEEATIILTKKEYQALTKIPSKKLHKIRYYYPSQPISKTSAKKHVKYLDRDKRQVAEIDIFLGKLKGLVAVEFEFKTIKEKNAFKMPDFCLADVTQEKFSAGGILAGKSYSQLKKLLKKYNYQPIYL